MPVEVIAAPGASRSSAVLEFEKHVTLSATEGSLQKNWLEPYALS